MGSAVRLATIAVAASVFASVLPAQEAPRGRSGSVLDRLTVSGAYLGVFALLHQDNRSPADPVRLGFDFAVNLDVSWRFNEQVQFVALLQTGTGGSEIGFQGPDITITDLNVLIAFPLEASLRLTSVELTVGSFDTPFGEQTGAQTNNADVSQNPVLLNSLLYSVLGGTVGTLNTLGVMGTLHADFADFTAALTNGTDESATNPDGNFEIVLSAGTDFGGSDFRAAGSFIASDDRDPSGSSGFAADLTGVLGELRFEPSHAVRLKGYIGALSFGDGNDATKDGVVVWMSEARYRAERWHLAARVSGWIPDDRDGSRTGVSAVLPNPGLSVERLGFAPDIDQEILRLQIGGGIDLAYGLGLRAEVVLDDYRQPTAGRSTDVAGLILALTGSF